MESVIVSEEMKLLLAKFNFNKSDLARYLDVTPQAVKNWYDAESIPAGRALQIEKLTNGEFKAVDLCKDFL